MGPGASRTVRLETRPAASTCGAAIRVDGGRHVFFVANAKREGGASRLVFDVQGLKPELWTGQRRHPRSAAIRSEDAAPR